MIAGTLLSISGPLIVRHAIDTVFPTGCVSDLAKISGLLAIVIIASFFVSYLQQINLQIVGQAIVKTIRIQVFTHMTRLPQAYFSSNPVGTILSRIESDTEALRNMFTNTVITLLSDTLLIISIFGVMFVLSWQLALILSLMAPLVIIMAVFFNRIIVPIYIQARRETAKVYGFLEEYLRGVRVIQAYCQEDTIIRNMNDVNRRKFEIEYPGEWLSNLFGHSIFMSSTIATVLVLTIGGYWSLHHDTRVTVGTLVAFLGYIQRFFGPVFHLSEQLNVIQRAFAGIRRIDDVLSFPEEMDTAPATSIPDGDPEGVSAGLEFRHVWFAYEKEDWVLQDINLVIPRGKRFAVVGTTGSGKTTLVNLLFRFYRPQRGAIFLDGVNILGIPLETLRRQMGLVLQDIVLFPGTVLDNLRLDNQNISDECVMNALRTVGADSILTRSDRGLRFELSEHGSNLSVGERQLLSFARALVNNPEILILDEATSSVDPESENRIRSALKSMLSTRTSLVIAHRLNTILDSDCIIVMQDGQIMERGRYHELVQMRGIFFKLCQIQFGDPEVG